MNTLNQLPPTTIPSYRRRGRGLGSGRGSKSGRGTTRHQTARTNMPLHFEGGQGRIVKKYPLLRGKFQNRPSTPLPYILGLSQIASLTGEINVKVLIEKNMVPADAAQVGVKILFDKDTTQTLTLAVSTSASVKAAVEKAGGKVIPQS